MKAIILSLGILSASFAQSEEPKKRLESVRIDPQELKLTWTVTEGTEDADGKFTATAWREFSIDLDKATMEELTLAQSDAFREFPKHNRKTDEVREFTQREADSVLRLVAILARYAADSTEWWDLGMGRKKPEGRIAAVNPNSWPVVFAGDPEEVLKDASGYACEERRFPGMTFERCYAIEGEFGYPSEPFSELGWTTRTAIIDCNDPKSRCVSAETIDLKTPSGDRP